MPAPDRGPAVRVRGTRELAAALRGLTDGLNDLRDVNMEVALIVAQRAVAYAPKDSGDLAVSTRASATRYRARVRSRLVYANVQHWGWPSRGIDATLYASSAAADTEARWLPLYVDKLQELCDKVEQACPAPPPLQ